MTEQEKAARGELYDATCAELQREMLVTRHRLFDYNRIPPDEEERIRETLRGIVHIGKNGTILQPFHCDYGRNIRIGDNFFANVNLVILDGAAVTIGHNVLIGPNVGIYTAGHPLDIPRRAAGLEYAYPVTIGNDVWIGGGAQILPGASIGDGTVIGAGSVVRGDIPAGVLAAGNPCRVIRPL